MKGQFIKKNASHSKVQLGLLPLFDPVKPLPNLFLAIYFHRVESLLFSG
jgi:hypothetical protein